MEAFELPRAAEEFSFFGSLSGPLYESHESPYNHEYIDCIRFAFACLYLPSICSN
jgi:hypothetical protein